MDRKRVPDTWYASRPLRKAMYDLETAKKLLGFEPRDRWPEGIEDMSPNEPEA